MASSVNIVLVHGAWCDGSSWSAVIPALQAAGHRVISVQLPLTTLADDAAEAKRALARVGGPAILVGHSYGSAVISAAGSDAPEVRGLVYVAAYAPDEGESVLDIGANFTPTAGGAAIRPDDRGYLLLDPALFPEVFAADVDPVQAHVLAAVQKPTAGQCFGKKMGKPAWRTLPSWYVVSEQDQMIDAEAER